VRNCDDQSCLHSTAMLKLGKHNFVRIFKMHLLTSYLI